MRPYTIVCVCEGFVLHAHPQSMLQKDEENLRVTGVNGGWDPWSGDHMLA